jgi:hypothetical protein
MHHLVILDCIPPAHTPSTTVFSRCRRQILDRKIPSTVASAVNLSHSSANKTGTMELKKDSSKKIKRPSLPPNTMKRLAFYVDPKKRSFGPRPQTEGVFICARLGNVYLHTGPIR